MGKVLSLVIGIVCLILGVLGLANWGGAFLAVLKGSAPAILILVGAIALFAGISEIKDSLASKKEAPAEEKPAEEKKEEAKQE